MTNTRLLAARLRAQLLSGPPARDVLSVAARLLAVQAQDPRGARLAVRARSTGLTAAAVDRALTEERSVVVSWLNRGTLHLVPSEDWPWLHALTTPPLLTSTGRRLLQLGVDAATAERGVGVIVRSLGKDGPLGRAPLRARLEHAGVPTRGQALLHLIYLACLREGVVRGPVVGRDQAFVLARDWLGSAKPIDRDVALAELARRYLAGHGPASERDLARWSGLPLRDARAGLKAIGGELDVRPDGLVDLARRRPPPQLPPPQLLGPFEPLLLGWTSREDVLGHHQSVVTVNGLFRPIALVEGRAVGTWSMPRGEVVLAPFARLARDVEQALEADAVAVARFLRGDGQDRAADPQ